MTATATSTFEVSTGDGSVVLYTWSLTTANPDGAPISAVEWADRTWQVTGTFGGATLQPQGSNDGVNWFPLSNAAGGAAVSLTVASGVATIELPRYVRPNLTTVGVGAVLTATLCARRAQPLRA